GRNHSRPWSGWYVPSTVARPTPGPLLPESSRGRSHRLRPAPGLSGIRIASAPVVPQASALRQGGLALLHRLPQPLQALAPFAPELPVRQAHDLPAGGHHLDQAQVSGNSLDRVSLVTKQVPMLLLAMRLELLQRVRCIFQ